MKICPKCQKTYDDDGLNFCLDDGSVLDQKVDQTSANDSLPQTVMMSTPRPTSPNEPVGGQSQQSGWAQQPTPQQSPPAWGTTPNYQGQTAPAKSKGWIWVVGILVGVVVLCGGGLVGLIALMTTVEPTVPNNDNSTITFGDNKSSDPKNDKFEEIDMSTWEATNRSFAESEYKNSELIMGTVKPGFYYVLVSSKYKTEDRITRLTVRNTDEKPSRLGYGLIFHSDPTPLKQDYGLLIDADKKRYRVVKHSPGKETNVLKWTSSSVIKGGSQKNVLEVRDKDGKIDLYINGQFIDSIKNEDGYGGGHPGIYTGDAVKTAFSALEIGN